MASLASSRASLPLRPDMLCRRVNDMPAAIDWLRELHGVMSRLLTDVSEGEEQKVYKGEGLRSICHALDGFKEALIILDRSTMTRATEDRSMTVKLQDKIEKFEKEVKTLKGHPDVLSYDRLKKKVARSERHIDSLEEERKTRMNEIEELEKEISALKKLRKDGEVKEKQLEKELADLKVTADRDAEMVIHLNTEKVQRDKSIDGLHSEISSCMEESEDQRQLIYTLQKNEQNLKAKSQRLEREVNTLKDQNDTLSIIKSNTSSSGKIDKEKEESQARVEWLESEIASWKKEHQRLKTESENTDRTKQEWEVKANRLDGEVLKLKDELHKLKGTIGSHSTLLNSLRREKEVFEPIVRNLESTISSLKDKEQKQRKEFEELKKDEKGWAAKEIQYEHDLQKKQVALSLRDTRHAALVVDHQMREAGLVQRVSLLESTNDDLERLIRSSKEYLSERLQAKTRLSFSRSVLTGSGLQESTPDKISTNKSPVKSEPGALILTHPECLSLQRIFDINDVKMGEAIRGVVEWELLEAELLDKLAELHTKSDNVGDTSVTDDQAGIVEGSTLEELVRTMCGAWNSEFLARCRLLIEKTGLKVKIIASEKKIASVVETNRLLTRDQTCRRELEEQHISDLRSAREKVALLESETKALGATVGTMQEEKATFSTRNEEIIREKELLRGQVTNLIERKLEAKIEARAEFMLELEKLERKIHAVNMENDTLLIENRRMANEKTILEERVEERCRTVNGLVDDRTSLRAERMALAEKNENLLMANGILKKDKAVLEERLSQLQNQATGSQELLQGFRGMKRSFTQSKRETLLQRKRVKRLETKSRTFATRSEQDDLQHKFDSTMDKVHGNFEFMVGAQHEIYNTVADLQDTLSTKSHVIDQRKNCCPSTMSESKVERGSNIDDSIYIE